MSACLLKYVVVFYNFLFWLLGVLILGLSAYLWWDSQNYLDEVSQFYITPFVVLLILGAIMTVVGFLGCCGAVRESRCLLAMYFLFCITMCIISGAFLYWAVQNTDKVRERIKLDTTRLIKVNYGLGATNATEMLVNRIQRDFNCCGISGPEDWIRSQYNNINSSAFERGISAHLPEQGTYRIPASCCKLDSVTCVSRVDRIRHSDRLADIEGINLDGCMNKFQSFIREKWHYILLAGFVLLGVQVLALLFACMLCCAISRDVEE